MDFTDDVGAERWVADDEEDATEPLNGLRFPPEFHCEASLANRKTRIATVDVSLRFLPSLLNTPILSHSSHNFPLGLC